MQELVDIAKQFGPSVAFMAFTLWRDFNRENRMGKQLDDQSAALMTQNTRAITAIEQNSAATNRLTHAIEHLPCRPNEIIAHR